MMEGEIQQYREKKSDEIYCRSCGEIIKKEAEICPHCGVRNLHAKSSSLKESNPSASWSWYNVVVGSSILWVFIWIFPIAIVIATGSAWSDNIALLMGFLTLVAWVGLPLSLYYDIQYVRANNEKWNPGTALWVIGGSIWIVNIIVALVYIIRRRENMN